MKSIKLAAIIDPIETLNIKKDSTILMLQAAADKGAELLILQQHDLMIEDGIAYGYAQELKINLQQNPWYTLQDKVKMPLSEFNIILMRKDPPFDMNYIHTTYVLEIAEKEGVLVVNKPQSLRDANEKVFISHFPQCLAPTIYTMDKKSLKAFIEKHQKVVLKPLDSMGGTMIFVVSADELNLNVILETLTYNYTVMITAQKYIPEIKQGDKRILLINGKPLQYGLARIPNPGDPRGNLAAGGQGKVFELSKREHWLCEEIAEILRAKGLIFVGIDVIGDYITEINVTSPTCIKEIASGSGVNAADLLMGALWEMIF